MYADDIKIYGIYDDENYLEVRNALQTSLAKMSDWASKWDLRINHDKSLVMHIGLLSDSLLAQRAPYALGEFGFPNVDVSVHKHDPQFESQSRNRTKAHLDDVEPYSFNLLWSLFTVEVVEQELPHFWNLSDKRRNNPASDACTYRSSLGRAAC
ncbi:hypothetical protein RB195_020074 [Necator americanus]|uniref:Reverse transcriptase domain-containing protein n=1 Tax=Necator americanus TaxID=51031 RepID=A0ABR1CH47_NECAM